MMLGSHIDDGEPQQLSVPAGTRCSSGGRNDIGGVGRGNDFDGDIGEDGGNDSDNGNEVGEACEDSGSGGGGGEIDYRPV